MAEKQAETPVAREKLEGMTDSVVARCELLSWLLLTNMNLTAQIKSADMVSGCERMSEYTTRDVLTSSGLNRPMICNKNVSKLVRGLG